MTANMRKPVDSVGNEIIASDYLVYAVMSSYRGGIRIAQVLDVVINEEFSEKSDYRYSIKVRVFDRDNWVWNRDKGVS